MAAVSVFLSLKVKLLITVGYVQVHADDFQNLIAQVGNGLRTFLQASDLECQRLTANEAIDRSQV